MKLLKLSKYIFISFTCNTKGSWVFTLFSIDRKVRSWMDEQNTEFAEKTKEAKQEVIAAKNKVKKFMKYLSKLK